MTFPQRNIAKGFFKSLSKVRETHEFEDFKVTVDGEIFSCNSFILGICSDYFCGLLRSNMKEKQDMAVELNNISSPIFELILNTIYTGCELVTKENIRDVWLAVHQLQIQFLIEHCEDFVIQNLSFDNLESFKSYSEYLQSTRVEEFVFNFIIKNFSSLREKEIFLNLKIKYLKEILESDELVVGSEDEVLYSIFHWVNYGNQLTKQKDVIHSCMENIPRTGQTKSVLSTQSPQYTEEPKDQLISENNAWSVTEKEDPDLLLNKSETNNRKKHLMELIKASRYYLASETCLCRLYSDKLIENDLPVKEILFKAFNFKFLDSAQGHCPTSAIHRDNCHQEHVAIVSYGNKISALSLKQDKWFCIEELTNLVDPIMTVFKGKVYACSREWDLKKVYVLQTDHWATVTNVPHPVKLFLAHENYIYVFNPNTIEIKRFNPVDLPIKFESFVHEVGNPTYALSFHGNILVFSPVDNNIENKTAVQSWNTETNVWTLLDNIDFLCHNMTSFNDDNVTYILDCRGSLLKVTNTESIGFEFIAQLWSGHCNIKGALLFRKTFFIFHHNQVNVKMLRQVEGVYSSRNVWDIGRTTSNIVYHIIPTNALKFEENNCY